MKIGPNGDNENQAVSKPDNKSDDKDKSKDFNKSSEQKPDSDSKTNRQDSKSDKSNDDPNKKSDDKNDSDKPKEQLKDKADPKKQLKNNLKKALTGKKPKQKNPLKEKADNLGKKAAKKAARVAAPKMALAYGLGKAYDKLHKGLAVAITAIQQSLYNNFVNSPLAGFINFMHGLWQGAVNAVHATGAFIGHAAGAIGSFLGGIGSSIGGAFGSIGSAFSLSSAQLSTVLAVGALLFGGGIAGVTFTPNQGMRDGQKLASCLANVENAKAGGTSMTNTKQKELENAKKVYEAGRAFGLSKNQALGMVGNFHVEGAFIDPTAVESIFDEPYTIGPRKKAALSNLGAFAGQAAAASGGNADLYKQGGSCPGLGIGQWTAGNGLKLLAAAKKLNADWYTLDFQLAYVFGTPSPTGRTNFWDEFKKQSGSVEDCTAYFEKNWEGIMDASLGERQRFAKSLESQADSWSGDSSFAKSVVAMAKKMGAVATEKAVSEAAADCADANDKANNSDAVKAALSYAWDNNELAKGNNGTPLYQKVADGVLGDHIYQSCDRNVAAAMRWSGTDIDYPAGNTSVQLHYLEGSPKWKHIGNTNSVSYDQLQPGDVMVNDGEHTYLYVGNKAVKDSIASGQHKKSDTPADGDEVDASYGQRSAGIGVNAAFSIKQHGDGPYEIYRIVKPDKSDKYKNVASDVK